MHFTGGHGTTAQRGALGAMRALAAALSALAVVAACATPAGAAVPKAGTYSGTLAGKPFTFKIAKGACATPKGKLDDPNHGYKKSSGLCFSSVAQPELTLTCDQGLQPFTRPFDLSGFHDRFTGSTIRDRLYAFTPDSVDPAKFVPAGYTELKVTVTGKKATGYVRGVMLPAGFPAGGNTTCDSGDVAFTAKRR